MATPYKIAQKVRENVRDHKMAKALAPINFGDRAMYVAKFSFYFIHFVV